MGRKLSTRTRSSSSTGGGGGGGGGKQHPSSSSSGPSSSRITNDIVLPAEELKNREIGILGSLPAPAGVNGGYREEEGAVEGVHVVPPSPNGYGEGNMLENSVNNASPQYLHSSSGSGISAAQHHGLGSKLSHRKSRSGSTEVVQGVGEASQQLQHGGVNNSNNSIVNNSSSTQAHYGGGGGGNNSHPYMNSSSSRPLSTSYMEEHEHLYSNSVHHQPHHQSSSSVSSSSHHHHQQMQHSHRHAHRQSMVSQLWSGASESLNAVAGRGGLSRSGYLLTLILSVFFCLGMFTAYVVFVGDPSGPSGVSLSESGFPSVGGHEGGDRYSESLVDRIKRELSQAAAITTSRYYVLMNFLHPNVNHHMGANKRDVTLVTQCSTENIMNVAQIAKIWKGPISLAMYVQDPLVLEKQIFMLRCLDVVREHLSLHLAFRDRQSYLEYLAHKPKGPLSIKCENVGKFGFTTGKEVSHHVYAINIMRQLAVSEVATDYYLATNIDTFPTRNMRALFKRYADQHRLWDMFTDYHETVGREAKIAKKPLPRWQGDEAELKQRIVEVNADYSNPDSLPPLPRMTEEQKERRRRQVFVFPAFETVINKVATSSVPGNKEQLVSLINRGYGRNFEAEVWFRRQSRINYKRWLEDFVADEKAYAPMDKDDQPVQNVKISDLAAVEIPSYEVRPGEDEEFLAEPFYIAPRIAPYYDEQFVRMAFDRRSHCLEMVHLGFRFEVLPNEFLMRLGWQTVYNRPNLARAFFHNLNRWDGFQKEMVKKYGKYQKYQPKTAVILPPQLAAIDAEKKAATEKEKSEKKSKN